MQAPSYTFLMGEYVSVLKILIALPKLSKEAREFYQKRLDALLAVKLEDLPLFMAEQRTLSKEIRDLLLKALY